MKICTKCGEEKSSDNFSKDRGNKDGLFQWCKACAKIAFAAYKTANYDNELMRQRARYKDNPERELARYAAYRKSHRGEINIKALVRQKANPEKYCALVAARNARKLKATPAWTDQEGIKDFYFSAKTLTDIFRTPYHVDHIVPLRSKLVCGLHVPANLQVLTGTDNISKGNRHWPDMP